MDRQMSLRQASLRQPSLLDSEEKDLQQFESKIDEVLYILNDMNNCDKSMKSENDKRTSELWKSQNSEDDFIVKIKEDRTVINKAESINEQTNIVTTEKETFLREIEHDAAKRAKERKEREAIAQNLRKLGNNAFRTGEYERALCMYSKAIDHVKDSPLLYNNRSLTYIRLGLYKKAIIDADFVIQKLDEKNVRSWLNRAKSYYLLDEKRDFEKSINEAKKNNPKQLDFIEKTIEQIQAKHN